MAARKRCAVAILALAGCGVPGPAGHPPKAAPAVPRNDIALPAPVSAPDPSLIFRTGMAVAQVPFADPTTMEERESARYFMGDWAMANGGYQQEATPTSASMSFRRYDGAAFGTQDGLAT